MKIRIYYEDTDAGGVVYHSNYLKFCERARSEVPFAKSVPISDASKGYFLLTEANCFFIRSAKFGNTMEVKAKPSKVKNALADITQEIYRDETLPFKVELTLAYIQNEKPAKIDAGIKKLFKELF